MENMFKRTLLGAAIATAAMTGSANAAVQLAGDAVQFYGQAAGFMTFADNGDRSSVATTIESRIGFRGVVEFDDFSPNLIWQIEGGNADNGGFNPNEPWTHSNNGQLGARDTYLGLDFGQGGQFTFGRQLVAAYNYVDWPHSNPGLGNVFDWNNDLGVGFQDRADNTLRYNSANFGGFNFQASLSGMESEVEQMVTSVAASYSQDKFSVHAGVYARGEWDTETTTEDTREFIEDPNPNNAGQVIVNPDFGTKTTTAGKSYAHNYAIVGGSVYLGDLTLTAAYKAMETDSATGTIGQNAYSATAQYVLDGKWVFKGGYAATDDADGKKDSGDLAVTARLGYLLPSTYLFVDSRNYQMDNSDDWINAVLVGAEYYF